MSAELEDEHWSLIDEVRKQVQAFPGWRCAAVRIHPSSDPRVGFRAEAFSRHSRTELLGEMSDYRVRIEAVRETAEAALRALPEILIERVGLGAAAPGFTVEVSDGEG